MHVKPRNNRTRIIVIVASFLAVIIGGLIYVLGGSSTPAESAGSVHPVAVVQPVSAQSLANAVNCQHFTDLGPSQLGGAVDSGICYIGKTKYGINTFESTDSRDNWLKLANEISPVVPKWETPNGVIYVASDQTNDNR